MLSLRLSNQVLGLALGQQSIRIAQVRRGRGRARLVRCAVWTMPADAGWDQPQALGQALRAFLGQQGFTARQAVVGLPGRWLLTRPRHVPPAADAALAGILRLAVEREFPAEARDWAFDYAGRSSPQEKSVLLLAAAPRQRLDQVTQALRAARLRVRAVTHTTLALAAASAADRDAVEALLHLSPEGAELAVRRARTVLSLDRLAAPAGTGGDAAPLAGEIRRALAAAPLEGRAPPPHLTVWDVTGNGAVADLGRDLDLPVRARPDAGVLGLADAGGEARPCLDAAALALLGPDARRLPLDFLHSRLAPPRQRRFSRNQLVAAALVALVVLGGVYLVGDWYAQKHAVDGLAAEVAARQKEFDAARSTVQRLQYARGWYEHRPAHLDCLRALTLAFPSPTSSSAGNVWTSSLALRDDMSGTLAGKGADEKAVLDLLERLKAGRQFAQVKLLYLRQAERGSRTVSFALTFHYAPPE